jgi:hypothetical protein
MVTLVRPVLRLVLNAACHKVRPSAVCVKEALGLGDDDRVFYEGACIGAVQYADDILYSDISDGDDGIECVHAGLLCGL